MEHGRKERTRSKGEREVGKKTYARPALVVHGDVEAITLVLRRAGLKSNTGSPDIGQF